MEKIRNIVFLLLFSLSFNFFLQAQDSSSEISLRFVHPPRTELVSEKTWDKESSLSKYYKFSSQLSKEEIRDFYRDLFFAQGFKENKEITGSEYLKDYNKDGKMLAFSKGLMETVIITIYYYNEEKELTSYMLSDTKIKYVFDLSAESLKEPQTIKDMPVNSKVKQIGPSGKDSENKQVSYFYLGAGKVKDHIDFYQKQMPSFGWRLVSDQPRQGRYNFFAAMSTDSSQLPKPAEDLFPGVNVNVEGVTLTFKKQDKQCAIAINQLKDSAEVLKQNKVVNPDFSKRQGDIVISLFCDNQ